MSQIPIYQELNRANWDEWAPLHAASEGYQRARFLSDREYLSDVVSFDLPLLGEVSGQRGLHLQCHIGTDTLSLHRLGARMSGLDFSPASIAQARSLATETGADINYVIADVYAAETVLEPHSFDFVYTGIGALCWLPDITRWAQTVATLLVPGGRLFLREGHPVLWSVDEDNPHGLVLAHPYFEHEEPLVWDDAGTYVETTQQLSATVTHEWNHGLGEIMTALIEAGLQITGFTEHRSVPWEALPGRMSVDERGEWSLSENGDLLPLSYTLQATKHA